MIGVKNRGGFVDGTVEDEFEWADARISSIFLTEHNEDGTHRIPDPTTALTPLGGCIPYTGPAASVPRGWLVADGTAVSRVDYKSYFDLVGTTYGPGDGSLTFNLPDLRQRFPLGKAASGTGATLGASGGAIDHTHALGAHTHSFSATSSSAGGHDHGGTGSGGAHTHTQGVHQHAISGIDTAAAGGDVTVRDSSTQTDIFDDAGTGSAGDHSHSISSAGGHDHTVSGTTGSSSGTSGAENPPFLAVNYIIYVGV